MLPVTQFFVRVDSVNPGRRIVELLLGEIPPHFGISHSLFQTMLRHFAHTGMCSPPSTHAQVWPFLFWVIPKWPPLCPQLPPLIGSPQAFRGLSPSILATYVHVTSLRATNTAQATPDTAKSNRSEQHMNTLTRSPNKEHTGQKQN